jgi:hypothetical protein
MERSPASGSGNRSFKSAKRAADLAAKQGGRITTAQLRRCGLSRSRIVRWERNGRLYRVADGVYAVGHAGRNEMTPLHEALLIAGPGAVLSHVTAAWWWGLLRFGGSVIHVSAPGARRSRPGINIHHPAAVERAWRRGLPVSPVANALLDAASLISFAGLRRALAVADSQRLLSPTEMTALGRSGRRGSSAVRDAVRVHMPELAHTRSPLEDRFLLLCESHGIELPRPNYVIAGYEVDAVWPELRLAVELDGREVHGTPAAVVRDRRRELVIRNGGFELIRYGSEQVDHQAGATARDLRRAMARRKPSP